MPDLDELVRQITERVAKEVIAALHEPQVSVEDYPDWDEFPSESPPITEGSADNVSPIPRHEDPPPPSVLRQMSRGQVVPLPTTDDGEAMAPEPGGMRGDVLPIGFEESRGSGFDPRGNGDWFARQRQIDQAQRRVASWETQVKAV